MIQFGPIETPNQTTAQKITSIVAPIMAFLSASSIVKIPLAKAAPEQVAS